MRVRANKEKIGQMEIGEILDQHAIDYDKIAALVDYVESGKCLPPVLVVEMESGAYLPIDGHHRIRIPLELMGVEIDAYVIKEKQLNKILKVHFDSDMPNRLHDLDEYILIKGNKSYEDLNLRDGSHA